MDESKLPLAVQNLRKLWQHKKVTENMTQTEAANKLGYTQSALSHYLVNITSLNVEAIIKLANFLEVPPTEIDPDFTEELPEYFSIKMYPETLSGRTSSLKKVSIASSRDKSFVSQFIIDQKNDYFEEGTKLFVCPTSEAKAMQPFAAMTSVYTLSKTAATSKFKLSKTKKTSLSTLSTSKFHTHLVVLGTLTF